jgi:OmpA-OmpF porin, OOP family
MRSKLSLVLGVASLSVAATAAVAKPNGWYVGLSAGGSWVEGAENNLSFPAGAPAVPTGETWDLDTGLAAMLTTGYRWPSGFRLELEGGYRTNDGIFLQGGVPVPVAFRDTSLDEWSLMANLFYEFPLTSRTTLSLGAGLGGDHVTLESDWILTSGKESDTILAGQLIAQIGFEITSRLELFADYHYLVASRASFENVIGPNIEENRFEIDKHAALIGLRYDLQADEAPVVYVPPPAPPAPPPQMKQFVVFFGFNKFNLTGASQAVVAEAASEAKSQGAASIIVVGHTDTSGGTRYNQKLSEKRANSVRSELERLGISPGMISASGRGETELLVETGDGVKEPQNRRATIDLK